MILHGIFDSKFFDHLKEKKPKKVFVLEGRPSLESSRHCCRELLKRNIQPTLIADNMAGFLFNKGLIHEVGTTYQDVKNQDALCQIGSLILAVLGKKHRVPVYCYPSLVKQKLEGTLKDICYFNNVRVAPGGIKGYVPFLEWVPQKYITKIMR